MEVVRYIFQGLPFPSEFTVCCILFMLPLVHRHHFILRTVLFFAVQVMTNQILLAFVKTFALHMSLAFFGTFFVGIMMFMFCTECTVWDAVFGATCSFAVQHSCYAVYSFLVALFPVGEKSSASAVEWLVFIAVASVSYVFFARKLPVSGHYNVHITEAMRSVTIILPFAFFLSMLAENYYQQDATRSLPLFLICRVYAVLCCLFVLWAHTSTNEKVSVETELQMQKMLWQQQKEQYKLSRENIDIINRKCHDLKHQVAALRTVRNENQREQYLDEIEKSVMIYDSAVKTGNDALDTILTERSLRCEAEGISWTCMADGRSLDFMDPTDLYTIFGNVLDNAIESVQALEDPEQRIVAVTLYRKRNMTILQVENYYNHELRFRDGLPVTSKRDTNYHGFGMKSIKSTVEKYGGSLSIDTQNHIFLLCIVFPTP